MGNDNSRQSDNQRQRRQDLVQDESINRAVDIALQKQRQLYENRYKALLKAQAQEQDKKRNESIEKAIEALEQQKSKYEAKYNELLLTQSPRQNLDILNRNIEQFQTNNNSLYPTLEISSNIYPATAPSTPSTAQTFRYSATAPVSPAPMQNQQSSSINTRFPVPNPGAVPQQRPDIFNARPVPTIGVPVRNQSSVEVRGPGPSTGRHVPQTRKQFQTNEKTSNQAPNCKTCNCKLGEQIFQCGNGHSSCRSCRMKNINCGVCKMPITDMRNITLEGLISDLVLAESTSKQNSQNHVRTKCPNAGDGCSLSFKKEDMEAHLKECPFKDMDCPLACVYNIRKCSWRGKTNHIVNHFNDIHPEHCVAEVDKEMTLLNTSDNQRIVYFTTLGPFNFLIHIKVDSTQKCIFMTTQLFGTKISAAKWTYQFHVYNKQQSKRKYQFNDICHSNCVPVEDIFNEYNCAVIPLDSAQTYTVKNRITYKFYLTKNTNVNVDSKQNNNKIVRNSKKGRSENKNGWEII